MNRKTGNKTKRKKIIKQIRDTLAWINENWAVLCFFLSFIGVVTAWLVYDVSLLQPLEEIAARQEEYRYKSQQKEFQKIMVQRHLRLGKSFLNDDLYKPAGGQFKKVLKLDTMNIDAQLGLFKTGLYEILLGDYRPELVDRQIRMILEDNPEDPHALLLSGHMCVQLEEDTKAENFYKRAISSDPATASAHFALGLIYQKTNRIDDALKSYKEAVKQSRLNERYLNNLAYIYLIRNAYGKAIKIYERILDLDYQYLAAYLEIALAFRLSGDLETALQYQEKLVKLLSDKKLSSLSKNKAPWQFEAGDRSIGLFTIPEKKYYVLNSLSATLYLLGKDQDAVTYAKQANKITLSEKLQIKELVAHDLNQLINRNGRLRERAVAFVQKYLAK
jgi:tetratricopeptide (TPR) repeat protein